MKLLKFTLSVLLFGHALFASPQETVVFRTDRDIYISGEAVWINTNCLKSGNSQASDLSKIAYIEVLNHRNYPVKQLKLSLEKGSASTRFELPDTLSTGNYRIRAYTKWMRNYNANLFYTKDIVVINPFSKHPFPVAEDRFTADTVMFYAESGNVLTNFPNKILVKSFDKTGNTKSVSGTIVSPSGDTLTGFQTDDNGLATVKVQPPNPGNYGCCINSVPQKIIAAFRASQNGYALQLVNETNDLVEIKLLYGEHNNPIGTGWKLDVLGASGKLVQSYAVSSPDNGTVTMKKKVLPQGHLTAVLVNPFGEIKSARVFVKTPTTGNNPFEVLTDQPVYNERSPVTVNIKNPGHLSNVTMAVVKEELVASEVNINTPTDKPADYLHKNFTTNDWLIAHVPPQEIFASKDTPAFLPERKGEIISGTIVNMDTQQPISNKTFMLSFVSHHPTIDICETDDDGHFYFEATRFGEQEMVIQPFSRDSLPEKYKVNLDLPFTEQYSKTPVTPLYMKREKLKRLNRAIINMQIGALYDRVDPFPAIKLEPDEPASFYGSASYATVLDKYIELPTMEEIIRELVPHAHLIKKEDKFQISISEGDLAYSNEINSFCMVDGVPVSNQSDILKINAAKVKRIDVENRDVFVHRYKIGKVFNLITNDGDMEGFNFDKNVFRQSYQMCAPVYQFNAPDYSTDSLRNSRIPDFRNVLYWNPEVSFNGNDSVAIRFFTSDESARYTIVVQGFTREGLPKRQTCPLVVSGQLEGGKRIQ